MQRRSMTRKRWAAVLTIAGLALGSLFPLGCGDNPDSTVLDPPGGSGGVSGILQFQGVGGAPFPEARITPDFKAPSLCSGSEPSFSPDPSMDSP